MTALRTATLACLAAFPLLADDFSAWSHHARLVLNTAANQIDETLLGFPLLVRLGGSGFDFAQAGPHGEDLRFSKADGTSLPYEIESWDAAGKAAAIWVRLDTVRASVDGQSIRMHWGNPAAAAATNGNAVFDSAAGFTGVWHLGGNATGPRANAVRGGNAAIPINFDGDEATTGAIGGADSLDGAASGDYLDLGQGYADFSGGFSFSEWMLPTAVKAWGRLLDLGNGQDSNNIILTRVGTGDGIGFHDFLGSRRSVVESPGAIVPGQWQLFAASVRGKTVRLYRNGALILQQDLSDTMAVAVRTKCFLGRSNWAADQYYQGKLDEAELSHVTRGDAWMRMQYLNQKPAQEIPVLAEDCLGALDLPADTSVAEGSSLTLIAKATCATGYAWSIESGPAPRILDPERSALDVRAPRVSGDTTVVYRLTVSFPDSVRTGLVRVRIREAIPDPAFTLPALAAWNGKDSLAYRPTLTNLAAMRAAGDTVLHWAWSLSGPAADTQAIDDGLLLRSADAGSLAIRLCLDNGGAPVCQQATITVGPLAALDAVRMRPVAARRPARDALGRESPRAPAALFRIRARSRDQ